MHNAEMKQITTSAAYTPPKERPAIQSRKLLKKWIDPLAALSFQNICVFVIFIFLACQPSTMQALQHLGPRTASLLSWPAASTGDLQMHSTGKETAQLLCAHTHGLKRAMVWRRIMPH